MKRITSVRIGPEQAGAQLLDFVASRFTYRDRVAWEQELADGRFLVNSHLAVPETILAAGDTLVYQMPELQEPPVESGYTVLHEDADLLVVDKPAPLPCHPGGRFFQHTLWAMLKEKYGSQTPVFVNRLDRETSGIVLLARNRQAARHCQQQFIDRMVEKVYLVLVEGDFPPGETAAAGWLMPDTQSAVRKKVRFCPEEGPVAKEAQQCSTSFRLISRGNGLSLVEARPLSGRCHQIRATLLGLGFPVAGDKLYGVDENLFLRFRDGQLNEEDVRRLRFPRQALHAVSLAITHPANGEKIIFGSPLPEIFASLFPGAATP